MTTITIECDPANVSDGYHTISELYNHRCHLFIALMRSNPQISWRARKHHDDTDYESWFIAGMHLPTGDISYHLPLWMWPMLDESQVHTLDNAPEWDGHNAETVVNRLAEWFKWN